jgi:hypothetical protein
MGALCAVAGVRLAELPPQPTKTNSRARVVLFMHVESNPELLKRRVKLAVAMS